MARNDGDFPVCGIQVDRVVTALAEEPTPVSFEVSNEVDVLHARLRGRDLQWFSNHICTSELLFRECSI